MTLPEHLLEFCNNPWFNRAWTYQESLLAKRRVMLYGDFEISIEALVYSIQGLAAIQPFFRDRRMDSKMLSKVGTMLDSSGALSALGDTSLQSLAFLRRGAGCKNAVDLLYSLLDTTTNSLDIIPDYNKSEIQVFGEAFKNMIQLDNDLAIFGEVQLTPSTFLNNLPRLPSWMPDLRFDEQVVSLISKDSRLFSCANDRRSNISMSSDFRKLSVQGFILDSVKKLAEPEEGDNFSRTDSSEFEVKEKDRRILDLPFHDFYDMVRITFCDIARCPDSSKPNRRWDREEDQAIRYFWNRLKAEGWTRELYIQFFRFDVKAGFIMETNSGRLGAPAFNARPGDIIAIIFGSRVPILLRPSLNKQEFLLIGQCYVDRMMDGQAMELPRSEHPIREFVLV